MNIIITALLCLAVLAILVPLSPRLFRATIRLLEHINILCLRCRDEKSSDYPLAALGRNQRPVGRTLSALLPIIVGILVVLGFMLPWNYLQTPMGEGYQAGYHCGTIGWIVLALGTVPGILSCVPALDKHLRRSLLGVFFGATGVVILVVLAFQTLARGQFPIGIWITLLGFSIQFLGVLARSALIRPASEKKVASA